MTEEQRQRLEAARTRQRATVLATSRLAASSFSQWLTDEDDATPPIAAVIFLDIREKGQP